MQLVQLLLLFIGFQCSPGNSVQPCPKHWTYFQESCYNVVDTKETWHDANSYCNLFGGYLAELTTQDEIVFAKTLHNDSNIHAGVWIGLNDILEEGLWVWASSKEKARHTDWKHFGPTNNSEADCVEIFTDGYWHDDNCNRYHSYICEMSWKYNIIIG